jgi:carbon monoxide dehydrogenase subunit G
MRIDTDFAISRPPGETYALLLDLERVAPCFPGAELGGERDDGARDVRVTVRLGPMKLAYDGDVRIAERDPAVLRAVMVGNAREVRGAGAASARIAMRVEPDGEGSRVIAEADVDLSGRAAQMGKGIIEDVARRLVVEMAGRLEATLAAQAPAGSGPAVSAPPPLAAAPLEGGKFIVGVARDRLRDPFVSGIAIGAVTVIALRLFMGCRRSRRRDA